MRQLKKFLSRWHISRKEHDRKIAELDRSHRQVVADHEKQLMEVNSTLNEIFSRAMQGRIDVFHDFQHRHDKYRFAVEVAIDPMIYLMGQDCTQMKRYMEDRFIWECRKQIKTIDFASAGRIRHREHVNYD